MNVMLADTDLTPAPDALDRAAAEAETVRVVSMEGGYRIVIQSGEPVGDRRPRGPAHLGAMRHLGRDLPDLDWATTGLAVGTDMDLLLDTHALLAA